MARKRKSDCHPDRAHYAKGLCKQCHNADWYANPKNRAKVRSKTPNRHLLERYNITADDYKKMYESQSGLCALCDKADKLVVDHDHLTGRVRGLLCYRCNAALGGYEILSGNPRLHNYLEDQ